MSAGKIISDSVDHESLTERIAKCAVLLAGMLVLMTASPEAAPKRIGDKHAFDPLGFPGDDAVITEEIVAPQHGAPGGRSLQHASRGDSGSFVLQVQFFATTDRAAARDIRRRAETSLKDSVSLVFETPYYKLRTGWFTDYDRAEGLAVRLRAMGYESAWVVRKPTSPKTTRQER